MDYPIVIIVIGLITIIIFVFILIGNLIFSFKGSNIKKLFAAKNYTTLIFNLTKDVKKDGRNYLAHFYLGEVYFARDELLKALAHYEKVISINKYDTDITKFKVRERLADIYLSLGNLKEAQKELLIILDMRPNDYIYNYRVADILYQRNYRDSAKGYLLKTIDLNPKHTDSLFRLGQIAYDIKRAAEAFSYMTACLKHDSKYFAANYYIGLIYLDSMNYMHAIAEFDKSMKNVDYRLMSLYQKGRSYFLLNDIDRAIVELERGIFYIETDDSISLALRYLLADSYEKKGDLPMAISQWELISSINSKYRDVKDKLDEYKDIHFDDNIKDFITASGYKFEDLCKRIVAALNFSILEYTSNNKGTLSTVVAMEGESRWRAQRRNKFVINICRSNEDISTTDIRNLLEQMRLVGAYRGIIITSNNFSRSALDYASSRPVYLYDKKKLSELLAKNT